MKSVCSCVLILSLQFVCGQYASTPCPGVFDYEDNGRNIFGRITVQPVAPVTSILIKVNLTVAAQIFDNDLGSLNAHDSYHLLENYNAGRAITYFVRFPVTSQLPKVTSITINGDTICYGPGDIATPNTYVTTLSLQHSSYLMGSGGYNNFQHQPQTRPQVTSQTQGGTQTYHINFGDGDGTLYSVDKIDPNWITGNSPYYVVNRTNQQTQPTHQNQPPTQQIFQSRPTYEFIESGYQFPGRRPVRPDTPEPEQPSPADEPETASEPIQNAFSEPEPPATTTASPNLILSSEGTEDQAFECGVVYGGNNIIPLIFNGESYDRGEIPWLVAIYKTTNGALRFVCGGTLVSDRHIITAGHCMVSRSTRASISDILVKIGVHKLHTWSDDILVTRNLKDAHLHEEFKPITLQNDILVLTLDKPVTFNEYIRPACLWSGNTDLSEVVGRTATVAGWGRGSDATGLPHKVDIPIVSTNDCRASKSLFHELTYDTTLCAGDRKGSGPCVGDSGGGLFLFENGKWCVRGVVSTSLRSNDGICDLGEYVVFTDIAQFLPWIKGIMAQNK